MPRAKKRKTVAEGESAATDASNKDNETTIKAPSPEPSSAEPAPTAEEEEEVAAAAPPPPAEASSSSSSSSSNPKPADPKASVQDRMARFRSLQARAKSSSDQNLKEATKESQRLAVDPSQLTAVNRKHARASAKLLKADVEEAGGDFERKRAWDWTIDESERWDKRMKKMEAHRDDVAFRDYQRQSEKTYKRQLRDMGAPDLEKYTREKMAAIEKAAAAGTLEIVETEDGEMIAVDKDGTFFSTADSTAFAQHKPDKAAVDRLVADLRKAEEASLKKRRDRQAKNADDGGDVTYINEKNKQFNAKLARFYNKYTAEIRDSFERGTMV